MDNSPVKTRCYGINFSRMEVLIIVTADTIGYWSDSTNKNPNSLIRLCDHRSCVLGLGEFDIGRWVVMFVATRRIVRMVRDGKNDIFETAPLLRWLGFIRLWFKRHLQSQRAEVPDRTWIFECWTRKWSIVTEQAPIVSLRYVFLSHVCGKNGCCRGRRRLLAIYKKFTIHICIWQSPCLLVARRVGGWDWTTHMLDDILLPFQFSFSWPA